VELGQQGRLDLLDPGVDPRDHGRELRVYALLDSVRPFFQLPLHARE
jgi:hypothetical protein